MCLNYKRLCAVAELVEKALNFLELFARTRHNVSVYLNVVLYHTVPAIVLLFVGFPQYPFPTQAG